MSKTRFTEDELDHLEENDKFYASQIRDKWHMSFNPTTNKYVYTHPTVVADLRAKLVSTLHFQPQTEMERIKLELEKNT